VRGIGRLSSLSACGGRAIGAAVGIWSDGVVVVGRAGVALRLLSSTVIEHYAGLGVKVRRRVAG
jgi:hypothetical protein